MVAAFLSFMAQIILSKIEIAEFESKKISGFEILVPYVTNFGQNLRVQKRTQNTICY